ncbi:YeiH family protein [Flavobacterium erciyesense]|uniref:YeiH family protein n=1 Tax=Flavobacterium erciyesense TaxID=2825842 RepID=UPI00293D8BEF|nr:putative sulfate exporter family transporter [Flavobacterium erciyesense]
MKTQVQSNSIILLIELLAQNKLASIVFFIILLVCATGLISPAIALLLGIVVTHLFGNPIAIYSPKIIQWLLQISVVGLGFGMQLKHVVTAGSTSFGITVVSIASTLLIGTLLGKWFKTDRKTSHLIACGTAICGGSAIASIAPVIRSTEKQTGLALGVIFILNAIALFLFPVVGHLLRLSQSEFGIWSAIAIHDTSSVVGAASSYGAEALQIATSVKLARALWIIPISFVTALASSNKAGSIKIPYFIFVFLGVIIVQTYFPVPDFAAVKINTLSKIGLTITLFLIGSGLTKEILFKVGAKPLLQGLLLWVFIASGSLLAVMYFFD